MAGRRRRVWFGAEPPGCSHCGRPLDDPGLYYCDKRCRDRHRHRLRMRPSRDCRRKAVSYGLPSPPWVEAAVARLAGRAEAELPLFPGPRPRLSYDTLE